MQSTCQNEHTFQCMQKFSSGNVKYINNSIYSSTGQVLSIWTLKKKQGFSLTWKSKLLIAHTHTCLGNCTTKEKKIIVTYTYFVKPYFSAMTTIILSLTAKP